MYQAVETYRLTYRPLDGGRVNLAPRADYACRRVGGHFNQRDFLNPCLAAKLSAPDIGIGGTLTSNRLDRQAGIGEGQRRITIEFADDKQSEAVLMESQPSSNRRGMVVVIQHGNGQMIRVTQEVIEARRGENVPGIIGDVEDACVTVNFHPMLEIPLLPSAQNVVRPRGIGWVS